MRQDAGQASQAFLWEAFPGPRGEIEQVCSLSNHFLGTFSMPRMVLGVEDTAVSNQTKALPSWSVYSRGKFNHEPRGRLPMALPDALWFFHSTRLCDHPGAGPQSGE